MHHYLSLFMRVSKPALFRGLMDDQVEGGTKDLQAGQLPGLNGVGDGSVEGGGVGTSSALICIHW